MATLLPDGQVLIAGGTGATEAAKLYNPATGKFTATGRMISAHGTSVAWDNARRAADRRGYGIRMVGPRRARNRTICGYERTLPSRARMVIQP